jgi:xanthine dehydrogenase accessory factor
MVHGRNQYVITDEGAEYFIEAYTTPPQLVVCGGGHVSKALTPLAKNLGFRVFVTDDREEFANPERFPEADIVLAKRPEEALRELPINPNTFIIIATRGHRFDNVATEAAARTSARYVGLLGSKRKIILIYEDLMRNGVPIERIRELRSPVGLDINARTPEEIAVSIVAEMLMFRLGGTGSVMKLEDWRIDRIEGKVKETAPVAD